MTTANAAAQILASFLRMPNGSTPAAMFHTINRSARSAAFRLLSKQGLIEVDYVGCTGSKVWKLSAKGRTVRTGEELSAVL